MNYKEEMIEKAQEMDKKESEVILVAWIRSVLNKIKDLEEQIQYKKERIAKITSEFSTGNYAKVTEIRHEIDERR